MSSSTQPAIMAVMLKQLGIGPGLRVLEIGAGTGYNAALLSHLVGPEGNVVTMDLDAEVANTARRHLANADVTGVYVVEADGALGWPETAPYDRIILTDDPRSMTRLGGRSDSSCQKSRPETSAG